MYVRQARIFIVILIFMVINRLPARMLSRFGDQQYILDFSWNNLVRK